MDLWAMLDIMLSGMFVPPESMPYSVLRVWQHGEVPEPEFFASRDATTSLMRPAILVGGCLHSVMTVDVLATCLMMSVMTPCIASSCRWLQALTAHGPAHQSAATALAAACGFVLQELIDMACNSYSTEHLSDVGM